MSDSTRRDSDTHVMPRGTMLALARGEEAIVQCPACVATAAANDANDEPCGICGGVGMVVASQADEWLLRHHVPGPEAA